MAVKLKSNEPEALEEVDEDTSKAKFVNKTNSKGKRLILQEDTGEDDADVEHSGVVDDNGNNLYDKSPIPGGRILTPKGKLVNHRGHEIEEDGTVIDPDRYKDDTLFNS